VSGPPPGSEDERTGRERSDTPAPAESAPLSRLDPDRAAARSDPEASSQSASAAGDRPDDVPPPAIDRSPEVKPAVDTRRYRWMIGIFGLALVVAVSIYQFATHGVGSTGVPPGQRLHLFAAPLANTSLVGDPNLTPPCSQARHDRRALNICLDLKRAPLVLDFFVTGAGDCRRSVDSLQTLSREFPPGAVRFAAVAVRGSRAKTAALIRSHHWTIPVAYDRDGSVGGLYGVAVCPMLQLAYRGGIVRDRLVGDSWQSASAIGSRVRDLLHAQPPPS
jgi:hypothetical protein